MLFYTQHKILFERFVRYIKIKRVNSLNIKSLQLTVLDIFLLSKPCLILFFQDKTESVPFEVFFNMKWHIL